jgi:hypothetical protein
MGKLGPLPAGVGMTQLALGRKSCCNMIWIVRLYVIFLMTAEAVLVFGCKTGLPVALDTIESPVDTLQSITGSSGMIPLVRRDILPGECGVTICAMAAESELISVILTAFPMANLTSRRGSFEDVIQMAFAAGDSPVSSGEGEIGPVVGFNRPFFDFLLLFLSQADPMSAEPEKNPYQKERKNVAPPARICAISALIYHLFFVFNLVFNHWR